MNQRNAQAELERIERMIRDHGLSSMFVRTSKDDRFEVDLALDGGRKVEHRHLAAATILYLAKQHLNREDESRISMELMNLRNDCSVRIERKFGAS